MASRFLVFSFFGVVLARSFFPSFRLWIPKAVQRSALCRSRRELSNAYVLTKFGFDTDENGLPPPPPPRTGPVRFTRSPNECSSPAELRAQELVAFLTAAALVGHVAIVTAAKDGFVRKCCRMRPTLEFTSG